MAAIAANAACWGVRCPRLVHSLFAEQALCSVQIGRNRPAFSPEGAHSELKTRKYEAFYIVKASLNDAEVQAIADRFKGVVEAQGGTVEQAGKWDKRKLAYEIDGHKEGNYVLMLFESEAKVPQELGRQMRISDDIIRHRIFLREG